MLHLVVCLRLSYRCASVLTERVAETVWRSVQVEFAGSMVDVVWWGWWCRGRVPLIPFGSGWNGVPLVPLTVFWRRSWWSGVPLVPLTVVGRFWAPLVPLAIIGLWWCTFWAPLVPLTIIRLWCVIWGPLVPLTIVILRCGRWVPLVPLVRDRWWLRPKI